MSRLHKYLHRELSRVLDATADAATRHVISVGPHQVGQALHTTIESAPSGFVSGPVLAGELRRQATTSVRSVVLFGALTRVDDVYTALHGVADDWQPHQRLVSVSYNRLWRPVVKVIRALTGSRNNQENWIPPGEMSNLLEQSGFEIVERRTAVLLPLFLPILGRFINRWFSPLPLLRHLCIFNVVVARPYRRARLGEPSVSVIVAARNEEGNIAALVDRVPRLAVRQELIFVEGGSRDDTWGAIQRAIGTTNPSGSVVSAHKQTGVGKGDAVRLGFTHATGDILIILDADLSVPPEELTRFIELLRSNTCEFANGSRLVYPMERQAMQFLNLIGNRLFGVAFSYLLGQSVRDTLCGTKALWAEDYRNIARQRSHFGDFDPFGDFDLLFGAARLHLRIRDVPVHYKERVYGSTNISRFRHGVMLLRMTAVAARKLRFI